MQGTQGARRGGVARRGAMTVLAGALIWAGAAPAQADPGDAAPVEPAAPQVGPVTPAQGEGDVPAEPQPDTDVHDHQPEPGLPVVGGFVAGGHGTGPAVFTPLLGDEAHPVPAAPVNEALPPEIDVLGPYTQQVSCDPQDRPGVTALALLLAEHYDRPWFSGARSCIDYMSYHHDGRALDWALDANDPQDRRIADSVIQWLVQDDGEMAARFGIEYLIWNRLIWEKTGGWKHYAGHPHDDHIHFSLTWDGAQMRTSWWTGVAVGTPDLGPCPVPVQYSAVHQAPRLQVCEPGAVEMPDTGLGRVRPGEAGAGVSLVQEQLGIPASGVLDPATRDALMQWQVERELPVTGVVDAFSQAAALGWELPEVPAALMAVTPQEWQTTAFTPYLRSTLAQGDQGPAVLVLQEALGVEPDGDFGPVTADALTQWEQTIPVLATQAARRGEEPVTVTPLTWTLLERGAHPTIALRHLEVAEGDRDLVADPDGELAARAALEALSGEVPPTPYAGGAVTRVQELLGVEADGDYGPLTAQAVRELQVEAGLEPTGTVDGPTWVALEAQALDAGRLEGAPGRAAQLEAERAEAERIEAERAEAERAEAERAAAERAAAEEAAARAAAHEQAVAGAQR